MLHSALSIDRHNSWGSKRVSSSFLIVDTVIKHPLAMSLIPKPREISDNALPSWYTYFPRTNIVH